MRFQPKITFEQYRDTCFAVAAAKPKPVRQTSWKSYVSIGIVCLAIGLSPQVPAARTTGFAIFAVLVLCWLCAKPFTRWSQTNCLKAVFTEEQEALNNQFMTVDETGIFCEMRDGRATSRNAWAAFVKRIDMPDAYIFLPSPNSFIRVPKEMLSPTELVLVWEWSSLLPTPEKK